VDVMTHPHDREIRTAGGRGRRIRQVREFMRALRQPSSEGPRPRRHPPGGLRAIAVEPLEMPAPSETPGPVPEDEHRPNRTERAAAARGPVPAP
jgi:hypothetical protein